MRDPKRIKPFLKKLGECWAKVPDWRFGQLMCNFLGDVAAAKGDPFFIEDDEMTGLLDEYFSPAEEEAHEKKS